MKILLVGITGFLGGCLAARLAAAGHSVVGASRTPPRDRRNIETWVCIDLAFPQAERWRTVIGGVDAIVNAAGVFSERSSNSYEDVHFRGPAILWALAHQAGIRHVIQISALGARADAATAFLRTKAAADDELLTLVPTAIVVQPSLIFGSEGASARALLMLASLPVIPVPAGGSQRMQPVHIADVADGICRMLTDDAWPIAFGKRVPFVGPRPLALRDYLRLLRRGMGLPEARLLNVPAGLTSWLAKVGDMLPGALFNSSAWRMLVAGSTADSSLVTAILGVPPRDATQFIARPDAPDVRLAARLRWTLPVLRGALAFLWIFTAIVSFGLFPVDQSLSLLRTVGIPEDMLHVTLFGAAALDLILGLLTLFAGRHARRVWIAQAILISAYTVVISIFLPEYWLHPFGPISKNIPILAMLVLLIAFEPSPAGQRRR
ncbi:MAG TPA: SDR family oxidoreductase [Burkholderiaceae bacterium]|nr:SDR family oxidoreductase [Burkholderiaceae bacterium]